jgi:hypothetical protein
MMTMAMITGMMTMMMTSSITSTGTSTPPPPSPSLRTVQRPRTPSPPSAGLRLRQSEGPATASMAPVYERVGWYTVGIQIREYLNWPSV